MPAPTLNIRFTRGREGRPETLTCLRADGSRTWQRSSDYFVRHDLIHYAVETALGLHNAFWGMVAQGRELDAFGTRDGEKDHYPPEALGAEALVGLLQWPSVQGGPDLTAEELLTQLAQTCIDTGIPTPEVTPHRIGQIRASIRDLHARWDQIAPGDSLALTF